jgi:VIT1/CCC1 family predicted Fe2+/Mn2+ transporter
MGALLERSRRARTLAVVQGAPDEATALAEIDRVLEGTVFEVAGEAERVRLGRAVREAALKLPPERARVHAEDVYGALASGLLVVLTTIPAAIPFLLIDEPWRALRVSNVLLVGMLFVVGYQWGSAAHASPWRAGIAFLAAGAALVGIAIALGG